jgi:hypothetical protein
MPTKRLRIQTFAWLTVAACAGAGIVGAAEPQAAAAPIVNGVTVVLHLASESSEFILPADVIGVQPDGVLVLKAHDWAVDRAGAYEYTLTGKVPANKVTPNGFVTSEQITDFCFSTRHPAPPRASTATSWLLELCPWMRSH